MAKRSKSSASESQSVSLDESHVSLVSSELFSVTTPLRYITSNTVSPFIYKAKCTITFTDVAFSADPARIDGPSYETVATVDGFSVRSSVINFSPTTRINVINAEIVIETASKLNATSSIEVTVTVKKSRKVKQVGPS
jgi:hypothetical protein